MATGPGPAHHLRAARPRAQCGCDELIFVPCTSRLDQVTLLAEAIAARNRDAGPRGTAGIVVLLAAWQAAATMLGDAVFCRRSARRRR